ncbi:MAG: ACP S-malonyltransferase [Eubacteriales bacterium]
MGKIAFVFAGQGAQYSGMGKTLYDNSLAAKSVFDAVDAIRPGTSDMCFNGSSEQLSMTINTQPALYTVDLACAAVLKEMGVDADMAAGFSLGELAANAYAGTFSYNDGFELVCRRAEHMNICAQKNIGLMVAVLKLSNAKVEELAAKFKNVYPANYNSAGQVTVACGSDEYDNFVKLISENGGKAVKLAVSGAFHSPYMSEASNLFAGDLGKFNISAPRIPVYSNLSARPYDSDIDSQIAKQIMSPVRWEETILNMIKDGADTFIEAGAGKVLSGLIKRISTEVKVYNADKIDDIQNTVYNLKGN